MNLPGNGKLYSKVISWVQRSLWKNGDPLEKLMAEVSIVTFFFTLLMSSESFFKDVNSDRVHSLFHLPSFALNFVNFAVRASQNTEKLNVFQVSRTNCSVCFPPSLSTLVLSNIFSPAGRF